MAETCVRSMRRTIVEAVTWIPDRLSPDPMRVSELMEIAEIIDDSIEALDGRLIGVSVDHDNFDVVVEFAVTCLYAEPGDAFWRAAGAARVLSFDQDLDSDALRVTLRYDGIIKAANDRVVD